MGTRPAGHYRTKKEDMLSRARSVRRHRICYLQKRNYRQYARDESLTFDVRPSVVEFKAQKHQRVAITSQREGTGIFRSPDRF